VPGASRASSMEGGKTPSGSARSLRVPEASAFERPAGAATSRRSRLQAASLTAADRATPGHALRVARQQEGDEEQTGLTQAAASAGRSTRARAHRDIPIFFMTLPSNPRGGRLAVSNYSVEEIFRLSMVEPVAACDRCLDSSKCPAAIRSARDRGGSCRRARERTGIAPSDPATIWAQKPHDRQQIEE